MGESLRHVRQMWEEPSVPQITIIQAKLPFHVALVFFSSKKLDLSGFQCPAKQLEVTVDPFVACALPVAT